jgi:NAD(P)H-flavin reductase
MVDTQASRFALDPEGPPARRAVVTRVVPETPDSWTYWMRFKAGDGEGYAFAPGQFNMLYLFGIGEVAISISSDPSHPQLLGHTVRSVGRVTNAFRALRPGDEVGIRGPFGTPWPLDEAAGGDLVVVAGGVGICPVRPAIEYAMRHRDRYRRLVLLMGAREPSLFPYKDQLGDWVSHMQRIGVELHLTVDKAEGEWPYGEGVVTTLYPKARLDPGKGTAFICGPEIMMWFAAKGLLEAGVPSEHVWVSLERHMQCGIGLCGHCQLGPAFVCKDGPVFRWDRVSRLLEVPEL